MLHRILAPQQGVRALADARSRRVDDMTEAELVEHAGDTHVLWQRDRFDDLEVERRERVIDHEPSSRGSDAEPPVTATDCGTKRREKAIVNETPEADRTDAFADDVRHHRPANPLLRT